MERFKELITAALKPVKRRVPTKIPRQDKEKRLEAKKRRGRLKQLRKYVE
jgi:ribosome-associated protein